MQITKEYQTQILVVGAGLAGITAGIEAAEAGSEVLITSAAHFCSGSSFYPGTWGLGMIAPLNENDKDNLLKNIDRVGSGIANLNLSKVLVEEIGSRINKLEKMGVEFKRPDNLEADNSLIPCFDSKHRKWYGYTFKSARPVFKNKITELGITVLEKCEIIKLIVSDNQFKAALAVNQNNQLILIKAEAVVLASGGIGGLYQHSLNTADLNGYGQVMALEAGCKLTNVEFIQFIPGYLKPNYKTIFNERTFEYAVISDQEGNQLLKKYLPAELDEREILKKRAAHGPFSSRLESKYVDLALFKEYLQNDEHDFYNLSYQESIKDSDSLMIKEYFKWLQEEKGITAADPISIVPFEHASNGGLLINQKAATAVAGIYAAGEITGGMHGADRIGGLATANALVFGELAGKNAAVYLQTKAAQNNYDQDTLAEEVNNYLKGINFSLANLAAEIENLRKIMWENASILRSGAGLKNSLQIVNNLKKKIKANTKGSLKNDIQSVEQLRQKIKLKNYLSLAEVLLNAMLLRKESRGSHYRQDFPSENSEYRQNLVIQKTAGQIAYSWEKLNKEN
jgi:L-aspartate oxidase